VITRWLAGYQGRSEAEAADVARMRRLAEAEPDPWSRSLPLHFTASALVVHPDSGRVLLRWHQRMRRWLQAGGHADPGERDPLAIALREAREETGLPDLTPWPDGTLRHAVVCQVPAGKGEPAHEHADLRYLLATSTPDAARPENPDAPLRWLAIPAARDLVGANNLRHTLDLVQELLALPGDSNAHPAARPAVPGSGNAPYTTAGAGAGPFRGRYRPYWGLLIWRHAVTFL
jgi:8-oxo-dGTP pyrophosphatase MutT (NUDIX family)